MANRITEEQKEQINELYCIYGVKTKVAQELGISVSSVSKYIIPNYVSKANRNPIVFDKPVKGCDENIKAAREGKEENFLRNFIKICHLTEEEKSKLEELRKEIY